MKTPFRLVFGTLLALAITIAWPALRLASMKLAL